MRRKLRWLEILALVMLAAPVCWPAAAVAQGCRALVGGTVITMSDGKVFAPGSVVLRGERITAVGAASVIAIPEGCERIDTTGKWITPGLIDSNVHLILMTVPEFFVKYEEQLVEIALQSAQVGLKYGMTTMADTWGPLDPLLEARARLRSGDAVGSRVLIAGNIVGLGGPFSSYFMGSWPIEGPTLRYGGWVHPAIRGRIDALWEAGMGPELLAMTPEETADAMKRYLARGVDFVKLAVSGHGIGPVEPLIFSREALQAMAKVVDDAGLPLQTHSFSVDSLRLSIELDPDLLQHPNVMSVPYHRASERQREEIASMIDRVKSKGIYSALMAIPSKRQLEKTRAWNPETETNADFFLHRVLANRRLGLTGSTFEQAAAGVRAWLDAGVPFTLATDQGPEAAELGPVVWGRLGRAHFDRMEALQDLGVAPERILEAATINGAHAYRLGDEIGTIEPGKSGDLLVLDGDPLADVSNLRRIRAIFLRGAEIDRDRLPTFKVLDYDPEAPWPY